MTKVVYNACHGGFNLSRKAVERMAELGSEWAKQILLEDQKRTNKMRMLERFKDTFGLYQTEDYTPEPTRHDRFMVQAVRELGSERASGYCAELAIADIEGKRYRIDEYDGRESVETPESYEWVETE